jgi:carbonic anhydrase
MEVHVKHVPKDGITLVVGVMVETGTGPDTGLLGQILGAKPSTSGTPVPALRTAALIPPNRRFGFFRYAGSLTTPACDETVDWVVLDTPATARISTAQALELKSRYGPPQGMRPEQTILARPVQTASEHEVSWYRR